MRSFSIYKGGGVCVDGPEVVVKPSTAYKTTTNKTHKGGGGGRDIWEVFCCCRHHTKTH
jgi:hypothetical protein